MVATPEIRVASIADVPWTDVEVVFGMCGDPASCWCQFFKIPNAEWWSAPVEQKSARLHAQTSDTPLPPGLIAYLDSEPVGRCAVEPRTNYPIILRSKVVTLASTEAPDDDSVWSISCFVVRVGYRRRGIAQALADAAVAWARDHGARVLEGYPIDAAAKPNVSSAELYHGSVSLFEQAGFVVQARPTPGRALLRLEL